MFWVENESLKDFLKGFEEPLRWGKWFGSHCDSFVALYTIGIFTASMLSEFLRPQTQSPDMYHQDFLDPIPKATTMKPSFQKSKFIIEESAIDTVLSPNICTKGVQRSKPSGKHQKFVESQNQREGNSPLRYQSSHEDSQPPRSFNAEKMHGTYPSFGPSLATHVPVGSMKNYGQLKGAKVGKKIQSSKGPLILKVLSSQGSASCGKKIGDGNHDLNHSLIDQARTKEDSTNVPHKRQKIMENLKQQEDDWALGCPSLKKESPQKPPRLCNTEKTHRIYQSFGLNMKTPVHIVTTKNQGEITRAGSSIRTPSSKCPLISEVSISQGSTFHIKRKSDGKCDPTPCPVDQAVTKEDQMIRLNQRQKIRYNEKLPASKGIDLDHQSINKELPQQSDRSHDREKMDSRYQSIGSTMKAPANDGTMKNIGELTRPKSGMAWINSQVGRASEVSNHKGSTSMSRTQRIRDEKCGLKQLPLKRARAKQDLRIGTKEYSQVFPPDLLQRTPKRLRNNVQHDKEHQDQSLSKGKVQLTSSSIPKLKLPCSQSIQGIDIQRFHLHNPDKMCSSAALHYTLDLIKDMENKYHIPHDRTKYPPWEEGKLMWTTDTLLPFVYFVVSCNPDSRIWENIKIITGFTLKSYHQWCVEEGTCSDEEKLARFLLWHTEVMYNIAQLGPKIKSSQGNILKISIQLKTPRLSTLARNFFLVFNDEALKAFMKGATRRSHMLRRHVSETFEGDYQKGYPNDNTNHKQHGSVWASWQTKSHDIRRASEDVQWPKVPIPQTSRYTPILLLHGEIENNMRVKTEDSVSEFIHKWEMDFKNTIKLVKTAQSETSAFPPLSIMDFCRGIHTFLQQNNSAKALKYQVTLFSEFLLQDSKDKFYAEFWNYFRYLESKKLKNALQKKNSYVKKGQL